MAEFFMVVMAVVTWSGHSAGCIRWQEASGQERPLRILLLQFLQYLSRGIRSRSTRQPRPRMRPTAAQIQDSQSASGTAPNPAADAW